MSTSRATATISTSVGTNWAIVSAVPSTPARRRSAQASTPSWAQKSGWRPPIGWRARRELWAMPPRPASECATSTSAPALRGAALRDDVLGGAPAERPPERGDEQGGVEEREQGGDERDGGARDRHVDGEHAGRHGGCGEDRVGERPVGVGVERLELGVATEGGKPVAQMHRGAPLGVAAGRAPAELEERVELAERVDACGLAHRIGSMAAAVRVSADGLATPRPWRALGRCERPSAAARDVPAVVRAGRPGAGAEHRGDQHRGAEPERVGGVRRDRHRAGACRGAGDRACRGRLLCRAATRSRARGDRGRRPGGAPGGLPADRRARHPDRGARRRLLRGRPPPGSVLRAAVHGRDDVGGEPGGRSGAGADAREAPRPRRRSQGGARSPSRARPRRAPRPPPDARPRGAPLRLSSPPARSRLPPPEPARAPAPRPARSRRAPAPGPARRRLPPGLATPSTPPASPRGAATTAASGRATSATSRTTPSWRASSASPRATTPARCRPGWDELVDEIPDDARHRQHLSGKSSQTLAVGLLGAAAPHGPLARVAVGRPRSAARRRQRHPSDRVRAPRVGRAARRTAAPDQHRRPRRRPGSGDRDRVEVARARHRLLSLSRRRRGPGAGSALLSPRRAARAVLGCGGNDRARRPRAAGRAARSAPPTRRSATAPRRGPLPGPSASRSSRSSTTRENPYFAETDEWPGWPRLARRGGPAHADPEDLRFAAISWQELVPLLPLDEPTRAWAADKHGLD